MSIAEIKNSLKEKIILFKDAAVSLVYHDGIEHAGYLAFLLMLSFFPFIVLIVATIGAIGENNLRTIFLELILDTEFAVFIDSLKPRILEITSMPPDSLWTFVLLSAVWTASSIFEALRTALNKAYRVVSPPAYIWRRIISILEFMVVMTMILAVFSIMLIMPILWKFVMHELHFEDNSILRFFSTGTNSIRLYLLILFGYVMVSFLYHFLPNRKHGNYFATAPGTIAVLVLWNIAAFLFKFYIKFFTQLNVIYGSIAGIIITLLFFYICSVIFIYGAELNYYMEQSRKMNYKR